MNFTFIFIFALISFSSSQIISNSSIFNTTSFTYRQKITIIPTTNFTNGYSVEDILVVLDTKYMLEQDYILKDCSDLVFVQNRTGERIPHYIENGCDQENTRFYLSMNLSSIAEENNVFMYFRVAESMDSLAEEFDGYFYEMREDECDTEKGWKYDDSFEGRFPFIDSTKAGSVTGSLTTGDHSHLLIAFSEEMDSDQQYYQRTSTTYQTTTTPTSGLDHTHVIVITVDNEEDILPHYKEKYFCKNEKLEISKGGIGLFTSEDDLPSDYSRFIEKVNGEYGLIRGGTGNLEGGQKSHSHSISGDSFYSDNTQYVSNVEKIGGLYLGNNGYTNYYGIDGDHRYDGTTPTEEFYDFVMNPIVTVSHTHSVSGSCTEASNEPTNIVSFVMGKRNTEIFDYKNDTTIIMASGIPPYGFELLDENDGYFLRNGDVHVRMGNKGDNQVTHVHNFTTVLDGGVVDTIQANDVNTATQYYYTSYAFHWYGTCQYSYCGKTWWSLSNQIGLPDISNYKNAANPNHYHNSPTTAKTATEELPIRNILLLKRKPIIANVSIDSNVEEIGKYEERIIIVEPGCFPECLNNGTCIKESLNEEDYYVCNCTERYEGNYCQTYVPIEEPVNPPVDNGVDYTMLFVIIGISGVSAIALGICIIVLVVMTIAFICLRRKKRNAYSKKMIDSLVSGIDKETELQEQKEQLEEEKIKLETDKKKLEEEKEKEREEKEQLKKALEELKAEKLRLANQSIIPFKPIKKIKKDEIKNLKRLIGMKNGYETFKGTYGKEIVMFRVFKEDLFTNKNFFQIKNLLEFEINEYSTYNHPNIIKFRAISLTPTVGIATEFPVNGSLINYFNRKKRKTLRFLQKVRIFYEIANGIQYLHKNGKSHGDIRAENVFLTKELRPILDFGFNRSIDREHIYSPYCAPEIIKPQLIEVNEDSDDEDIEDLVHLKADIYAFGILMFEIVSENFNLYKIPKGKKEKIGENVANDEEYRPSLKRAKYFPNWFINLIKMCWAAEPERRPNITRIKSIIETIVFGDEEE